MSRIASTHGTRQRLAGLVLATAVLGFVVGAGAAVSPAGATSAVPTAQAQAQATAGGAVTRTEKISRVNFVDGQTQVVDSRTFMAKVAETKDLRNREEIAVSWSGAHPTGGIVGDPNSAPAPQQEYPVVLMECRGTTTATSGSDQITPERCWSQTSPERVVYSGDTVGQSDDFWAPRLDLYASTADRAPNAGVPSKLPAACKNFQGTSQMWVPFVAASGKAYDYGPQGCAGLPPEAANDTGVLQPSNTTYAQSDLKGNGSANFVIQTADTNASLGCSAAVSCALVIIPIMGISCDPAGDSLPPADRPPSTEASAAFAACSATGHFPAGASAQGQPNQEDVAVSGRLWWSASNWRDRIMVPLNFAPASGVCALVSSGGPSVAVYGTYMLLGATQQWAPYFCRNRNLFPLQHVLTSEPEAKNLLAAGAIDAAFQGSPPTTPFSRPIVQAPTAVTGFAIAFDVVEQNGHRLTTLRLDARLLAKLLTESYPADPFVQKNDAGLSNPTTHQPNPLNMADDPEFQALNPDLVPKPGQQTIGNLAQVSSATLLAISSDSDTMTALTAYINADPEARAWLNGTPDPWGMVVNPKYKGIKLPVSTWPLLDTYELPDSAGNLCADASKAPFLPAVASPVESMATISLDLQFDISDSLVNCNNNAGFLSFSAIGQESPGGTFILGVTSLADADLDGLATASLETSGGSTSSAKFTSSAGRTFVAPSPASLRAAVGVMHQDPAAGSWDLQYAKLRTSSAGAAAYPGAMLISTDVPTHGLPKVTASELGKFLTFAATSGQRTGFGTGQLPPGYLPLTAANGAAKMAAYTKAAAADVTAQNGKVPSLNGVQPHGNPTGTPTPTPTPSSTSGSSQPTSGSTTTTGNPSQSPSPSAGISTATTTPGTTKTQPIATTANVRSTVSGAIIPLVLLIALIGATVAYGAWQLTRPVDPQ